MKLKFHRSPAFVPAEYYAIIPGSDGYYIGIGRFADGKNWYAYILSRDLVDRLAGYSFSTRTKRELISWLNRHQDDLRDATLKLDTRKDDDNPHCPTYGQEWTGTL